MIQDQINQLIRDLIINIGGKCSIENDINNNLTTIIITINNKTFVSVISNSTIAIEKLDSWRNPENNKMSFFNYADPILLDKITVFLTS